MAHAHDLVRARVRVRVRVRVRGRVRVRVRAGWPTRTTWRRCRRDMREIWGRSGGDTGEI